MELPNQLNCFATRAQLEMIRRIEDKHEGVFFQGQTIAEAHNFINAHKYMDKQERPIRYRDHSARYIKKV